MRKWIPRGALRLPGQFTEFRAHMADSSRYSFGKRLWTEAASEGVSPDDPAAVEAFMERFNSRPRAERDTILGRGVMPAEPGSLPAGSRLRGHLPGRQASAASASGERPGSGGQYPPRSSRARAIRCSGLANPKAMRWRTRILVLVDSMRAFDRSLSMAASMPAMFFSDLAAEFDESRDPTALGPVEPAVQHGEGQHPLLPDGQAQLLFHSGRPGRAWRSPWRSRRACRPDGGSGPQGSAALHRKHPSAPIVGYLHQIPCKLSCHRVRRVAASLCGSYNHSMDIIDALKRKDAEVDHMASEVSEAEIRAAQAVQDMQDMRARLDELRGQRATLADVAREYGVLTEESETVNAIDLTGETVGEWRGLSRLDAVGAFSVRPPVPGTSMKS